MNITLPLEDVRWLLRQMKHDGFSHDFIKDEQRCPICQRIKAIHKKLPPSAIVTSDGATKRWDAAAQKATDAGLRPGSSEWYKRIRAVLAGEPIVND